MKTIITLFLAVFYSILSWASAIVNVNTATAEEIAEGLKGVGLTKAEAIVKYRNANGTFSHVDELVKVKGIGVRTVDINREAITLEGNTELASKDD
jgi:competence protein ComEA